MKRLSVADYRVMAFKRYQIPFGADQEKRMTRWCNHIPNTNSTPRWKTHNPIRSAVLDMWHDDSGAEGLQIEPAEIVLNKVKK